MTDLALKISADSAELKKGLNSAEKSLRGLEKNTANIGGQIMKSFALIGAAIGGAAGAVDLFKDTMNSTGKTADAFAETIEGIKQGFDAVKRAAATMDFKDFIKNIKTAFEEGKRYAKGLDDINDAERQLAIAEADSVLQIANLRKQQNSALSTSDEKIKAGKEIIRIEEELAALRGKVASEAYKNEVDNVASITKLTALEVEGYVRGDKAIRDKLAAGEAYNKQLAELASLTTSINTMAGEGGLGSVPPEFLARQKELKQLIGEATDEVKKFAYANGQMSDDPKLDLLTEKYVNMQNAIASGVTGTIRISTKLDKELAKEQKALKASNDELEKRVDLTGLAAINTEKMILQGIETGNIDKKSLAASPDAFISNLPDETAWESFQNGGMTAFEMIQSQALTAFSSINQAGVDVGNMIANGLVNSIYALTDAFAGLFTESEAGFKNVVTVALQSIGSIINALLVQAIAGMIAGESSKGLIGLATAAVGIGLLTALWTSKVKDFADGGLVYGETMARVGEYAGARTNPEVIAPLDKLKNILGGGQNGEVVFKIQGTELVGILNKQNSINYSY